MSLISKDNLNLTLQSVARLLSKKADKTDIVQSDWNQNNENTFDYIKSKPFYEYIDRNSIIIPINTYEILSSYGWPIKGEFGVPILGETYTVRFGESIYEKVCYGTDNDLRIGDVYEEFIIRFGYSDKSSVIIETSNPGQKEIEIIGPSVILKKLDEKYLPNEYMSKSNPTGTGSFSLNRESSSSIGNYSFSEGRDTAASGDSAHAEGYITTASGFSSHAEGYNTKASGQSSHAEGDNTTASKSWSHAEGYRTLASGESSHAEGYTTIASGNYSHTEGYGQKISIFLTGAANGTSYTILDNQIFDIKNGQIIYCNDVVAKIVSYDHPTLVVNKTLSANEALTNASASIYTLMAFGQAAHAEGAETIASGDHSHAEGNYTIASKGGSHAEGVHTTASGDSSHAEGCATTASGRYSHAEGWKTIAYGEYSHAEGVNTIASGNKSHAEGDGFKNSAIITHTGGYDYKISNGYYNVNDYVKYNGKIAQIIKVSGTSCKLDRVLTDTNLNNTTCDICAQGASGTYSHVEGQGTTASRTGAHAEGNETTASGNYSHAEGSKTIASGDKSHAEGLSTTASEEGSHAEGLSTTASEEGSHAEGSNTIASGLGSHAEGNQTIASGNYSHAEGHGPQFSISLTGAANGTSYSLSKSNSSIRKGQIIYYNGIIAKIVSYDHPTLVVDKTLSANVALSNTKVRVHTLVASGEASHAGGTQTIASGNYSHTEGSETIASGWASHAEGNKTTASSTSAHAEGAETSAEAWCHAEGYKTTAAGQISHAEGHSTTATGQGAHAEGNYTTASGDRGHAEGYYTIASRDQHVQGHYNTEHTNTSSIGTSGSAFIIGNGTTTARSNAFRITYAGAAYAKAAYNSTGADYAEFFEWEDGNFLNEDRRGYFVTLNNDKIKIATPEDDFILGVVSGQPAIIGNSDEEWTGRYILDEFGSFITEEFEYEEKTLNPETEEEIVTIKTGIKYKENPEYDPTQTYIQRQDRAEWATVGMLGVLSVRDDGTCQVNGYCSIAEDGIATMSLSGYRVIKRVNDNIIKIIFR